MGSCASQSPRVPLANRPTDKGTHAEIEVEADWNDVSASVSLAAERVEGAVLSSVEGDRASAYTIILVDERVIELRAQRLFDPARVRLIIESGAFAEDRTRDRFGGFVAQRLEGLRGVAFSEVE